MSEEARHLAFRQQRRNQVASQRWLDAQLTPVSQEPARQVRQDWEPIDLFLTEGPDIGDREDVESDGGLRFN